MRRRSLVVAALILMLVACQGNVDDVEEVTAERDQLAAERDQLAAQVDEIVAQRDQAAADLHQTVVKLEESQAEVEVLMQTVDQANDRADSAEARVQELVVKYDPEIRAERQAAYDAELTRACEAAKLDLDSSIVSLTTWTDEWESISTEGELLAAVEACAADERAKTAEAREQDRLAACGVVDVDELEKDPDAYTGTCIHMWAHINQYDANTGKCSFRADLSSVRTTYWLDYSGNAIFVTDNETNCPELDGIDVDDFIEVWATGSGSLTYDTTIGGSATATLWSIDVVKLVKKG